MNVWKASTLVLAAGLAFVVGKDAFTKAHAATPGDGDRPAVGWEWEREQVHMEKALHDLEGARHSLDDAAEHKGGWKLLAIRHTEEAIAETRRGIEYGRTHPRE